MPFGSPNRPDMTRIGQPVSAPTSESHREELCHDCGVTRGNRWISEAWWRDSLFWVGVVFATAAVTVLVVLHDDPWWRYVFSWWGCFAVAVAVVGFARTVVRSYRDPR